MARVYRIEETKYKDIDNKEEYIKKYGHHFNEKLCNFAVSKMYFEDEQGNKVKLVPYDEYQVSRMLKTYNIKIDNDKYFDKVFVANMCKADYLGSSIEDEQHLAMYIKDVLDDVDGYEGIAFARWLADVEHKKVNIDWNNML